LKVPTEATQIHPKLNCFRRKGDMRKFRPEKGAEKTQIRLEARF
jgi:hypothetical protein